MISLIKGVLEGAGSDWADVSLGGVTLRVSIPSSTVERLGGAGDQIRLFTSLQVREDSLTLFGFLTEEARMGFEALIAINGVGPRVALSVLSRFTPGSLANAVRSDDTGAFTGVSGVGKKTASRIILELKGKLVGDWAVSGIAPDSEVIEALVALGYSVAEARDAAPSSHQEDVSLEEKVRQALQSMGGH